MTISTGPEAPSSSLERDAQRIRARVGRKLWLSKTVLALETLWPGLWPPAALAGLFISLALLDVPRRCLRGQGRLV